jgi:hypothetical protein
MPPPLKREHSRCWLYSTVDVYIFFCIQSRHVVDPFGLVRLRWVVRRRPPSSLAVTFLSVSDVGLSFNTRSTCILSAHPWTQYMEIGATSEHQRISIGACVLDPAEISFKWSRALNNPAIRVTHLTSPPHLTSLSSRSPPLLIPFHSQILVALLMGCKKNSEAGVQSKRAWCMDETGSVVCVLRCYLGMQLIYGCVHVASMIRLH